jgi:hypothetical protein
MSFTSEFADGSVEECLDVLNDVVKELPYPPAALAVALRVHLEALLQALLLMDLCTREEARAFLREMERDVLEHEDGTDS